MLGGMKISERLASWARRTGTTPSEIAHELGTSRQKVSQWLAGQTPRASSIPAIADMMGVDARVLLAGEDARPRKNRGPRRSRGKIS
jgi:transcriptional regulator with XRE-family HTH domain